MLHELNALDGRIQVSKVKVDAKDLAIFYNMADCTINISDAEGFGLATLESLACGTPIIVNMTGGLQEQVTDGKKWFGVGIEPCSKAVIGSQQVPFIYEDRISKEDFHAALDKMYNMSKEERETMGDLGSKHVEENYNFKNLTNEWVKTMDEIHEKYGSWENRKGYDRWTMTEVKL
jgi:glycosyltransferase involved in cell wall biosynthesis